MQGHALIQIWSQDAVYYVEEIKSTKLKAGMVPDILKEQTNNISRTIGVKKNKWEKSKENKSFANI